MSTGNIQFFDWGKVEWIYEPDNINSFNVMNIGIYTILPGKGQKRHIHYGDEQLLFVLSGKGKQLIGDIISSKEAGSLFHIEAGLVHETINTGNEPLMELVISIPANYENSMFLENNASTTRDNKEKYVKTIEINDEIKNIYDGFAHSLKIPISIFDKDGNAIIEGKGFPYVCETRCKISESINNCCMYNTQDNYANLQYSEPTAFTCPYGLSVIIMSTVCNGEVIGIIKGGHIIISQNNSNNEPDAFSDNNLSDESGQPMQFFSKASMKALFQQFKKLNKYILNYYILKNKDIELDKKEEIIQDISRHEIILQESLKSTQEKVLSIQINNHFLFNTLNAIASLAFKENAIKTYDSIINLSKMFRYTLKTGSNFVTLKDEMEYLANFIDLQKLRFGDRLRIKSSISLEIVSVIIPFNCLQPIVENCFIHGFKNKKGRLLIEVNGKRDKNLAIIEICDNGTGMGEKDVEILNRKIRGNYKDEVLSGLMMIYSKLYLFYKEKLSFEISSSPNKGTKVRIVLQMS